MKDLDRIENKLDKLTDTVGTIKTDVEVVKSHMKDMNSIVKKHEHDLYAEKGKIAHLESKVGQIRLDFLKWAGGISAALTAAAEGFRIFILHR